MRITAVVSRTREYEEQREIKQEKIRVEDRRLALENIRNCGKSDRNGYELQLSELQRMRSSGNTDWRKCELQQRRPGLQQEGWLEKMRNTAVASRAAVNEEQWEIWHEDNRIRSARTRRPVRTSEFELATFKISVFRLPNLIWCFDWQNGQDM